MRVPEGISPEYLKSSGGSPLGMQFEIGLLVEGVHAFHAGGMLSTAHTEGDLDETVQAVERVLTRMKDEGAFA